MRMDSAWRSAQFSPATREVTVYTEYHGTFWNQVLYSYLWMFIHQCMHLTAYYAYICRGTFVLRNPYRFVLHTTSITAGASIR